jgi:hypothetical protein
MGRGEFVRDGYLIKSASGSVLGADELAAINRYTRRAFTADEVYAFTVVLCDNEVDRDYERFTVGALQKLSKLYLGKTGIFDHSMKSSNQTARIFSTTVETDESRHTAAGEPYSRLVARAYLPRTAKNADLILEIESGIKKEVSVGCAVSRVTCSICGSDMKMGGCDHKKGRIYGQGEREQLCCSVLSEPTDAYEWSFVAVPAQREAGVIKSFLPQKGGAKSMLEILKSMRENPKDTVLTKQEADELVKYLDGLEELAQNGRQYREDICKSVVKLCAMAQPELPTEVMRRAADSMTLEDLKAFEKAFQLRVNELLPMRPQLAATDKKPDAQANAEFKI